MQGPFLRKYGAEATINFVLFETDGVDFKTDASHASGDTKIMKDEGAEANTTNGFTDEGQGYSLVLTSTEMQAARIVVYVVDQGTKAWLDTALVIETYGNASAQHAVDLDDSVRAGLTALPDAAADAAGGLPISDAGGLDLDTQLGTDIDAILADTNELQGDLTNGGRLDLLIDAIKAKTDNLPADPADDSDIDSQLSTIDTVVDAIKAVTDNLPDAGALSDLATILADTNELQGDWVNGGRLDLLIDAIKAKTDNLPADPADDSDIDSQLSTIDTVVDAIKAVTDNLPDSGALSDLATILADTNELQGDWVNGGRLDLLIDAIKAKTDNLPADPADDSDIDSQLSTIDTVVDAIKAITDNLPDSGALNDLATILADTNELQTDDIPGLIAALNDPAAAAIADAVWDEAIADHTGTGSTGKALDDAEAPAAAAVADAVWDETLSDHDNAGSTGKALGIATASPGATEFVYTLTRTDNGAAIANARVWVTTTNDPDDDVIAEGTTDTSGQVTFYLDAGTYYLWRQKSGYTFTNPDTETIS